MTDLPTQMRAVELVGHGGPENLVYREDRERPEAGPGQVLIKVLAAGVNNTDINTRTGWYSRGDHDAADAGWGGNALALPRIQGADVCGMVVALGDGADLTLMGKRVLVEPCLRETGTDSLGDDFWYVGSEIDGGFADYMVAPAAHVYPIDCDLSNVELASFPCSWSTAENLLTRARVAAGDRVLITGASGGVGSAAIQLAKRRGAIVIAQTSLSKADGLRQIGADEIILRDDQPADILGENAVQVVVDLVGGRQWPQLLKVLAPEGRYAVSGAIAGAMVDLDLRDLYLKDLQFFGCTKLERCVFGNLIGYIEAGEVTPLVGGTWPLKEIASAQAAFLEKAHTGSIVLEL